MATTIGEIQLIAKIDTSQYKKGADEVKKANKEMTDTTEEVSKKSGRTSSALKGLAIKGFKVAAAGALLLGGAVATMTLKGGISRALNIEDAQAKLKGLGHDAKSVTAIMDDALASVKGTAFGLDAAATTAANSVAAGIKPGKQLEQVLKTVANSAAIAGTGMDEMGAVFNKVASTGKVTGRELMQLGQMGIPVLQFLAKELGKTAQEVTKMVSKGEVDFETFERAMRKGVGEAAIEMGKTTRGSWANMQAAMSRVGAAIVQDIIPRVRDAFQGITGFFDTNSDKIVSGVGRVVESIKSFATGAISLGKQVGEHLGPKLTALWNTVTKELVPALTSLWKNVIQPLVPVIGTALVLAIGLAVDALNLLIRVLSPVVNWLSENTVAANILKGAIIALAGALLIGRAIAAFTGGLATARAAMAVTTASIGTLRSRFIAMKLLMSTPIVVPALAIGAIMGSIATIFSAWRAVKGEIEGINAAADAQMAKGRAARDAKYQQGVKSGGFATGGFTGRGPMNEIAGVVHRGEYVIPKEFVNQSTGKPELGGTRIEIGNITIAKEVDADRFLERLTKEQEIISKGMTPGAINV